MYNNVFKTTESIKLQYLKNEHSSGFIRNQFLRLEGSISVSVMVLKSDGSKFQTYNL